MQAALLIAKKMKFRPKTVMGLDDEHKARYLASVPDPPEDLAARLLMRVSPSREQRPMMGAFLDALGIAHRERSDPGDAGTPDPAKMAAAAAAIARSTRRTTSRSISTRSCGRIRRHGGRCKACLKSWRKE